MTGVVVRGRASAEEVAVVLALLARSPEDGNAPTAYEKWRAGRRRALRHTAERRDVRGVFASPA